MWNDEMVRSLATSYWRKMPNLTPNLKICELCWTHEYSWTNPYKFKDSRLHLRLAYVGSLHTTWKRLKPSEILLQRLVLVLWMSSSPMLGRPFAERSLILCHLRFLSDKHFLAPKQLQDLLQGSGSAPIQSIEIYRSATRLSQINISNTVKRKNTCTSVIDIRGFIDTCNRYI